MGSNSQDRVVDDTDLSSISYSPPDAWGTRKAGIYTKFHNETYHLTTRPGASITFSFIGTYAAYYSDLNVNHDTFSVYIDGDFVGNGSSHATQWSGAPQLLFASKPLAPGSHSMTILNSAGPSMGLDSLVYRAVGPTSASNGASGNPESDRPSSTQTTSVDASQMTTRSFVAYYSDKNYDHGEFAVALDGVLVFSGNSRSDNFVRQVALFSSTIPAGPHTLTVTNGVNGTLMGVDYFV
ncbi:hypothetical protein AURDEDRAFT_164270 [Auricularia subglabra TFB-10046 SS5]|nr:hypothetical protein AURDEDRAFT_164270 [Auricularia subglabra TFB-10046 SS5]